jgi:hypothetical protein
MEYTALNPAQKEIRLLHLHPDLPDDKVECHFSITSLEDDDIQYEALSYVWGVSKESRIAHVNGVDMPITDNLWQALNGLRHLDKERILWVDALSINQLDNIERSDQVSHMNAIYTRAASVEIWLGEAFEHINIATKFITEFATGLTAEGQVPSYEYLPANDASALSDQDPRIMVLLLGMTRLSLRPWFERTWTFQEFFLARKTTFHCGTAHTLDGVLFMQFLAHLGKHDKSCCAIELPLIFQAGFIHLFTSSHAFHDLDTSNVTFLDCVANLCFRKATDPRDKIYGLLGVGVADAANLVRVDYTLSVEDVYEHFVTSLLSRTRNLAVFTHVRPDQRQLSSLPSFVPDWSYQMKEVSEKTDSMSMWMRCRVLDKYAAAAGKPVDFTAHPGILKIRGIIVDTVSSIATRTVKSVQKDGGQGQQWSEFLNELQSMAAVPPRDEDTWPAKFEAFWAAMTAGIREQERVSPAPFNPVHTIKLWRRVRGLDVELYQEFERYMRTCIRGVTLDDFVPEGFRLIDRAVGIAQNGRKFGMTREGRMGLVPDHVELGDVVAVLTGGQVPIVLRPEDGYHTVVGDAYVHGIMDGEAIESVGEMEYIELR